MNRIYLIIAGMTAATYIPRLLPFTLLKDRKPSRYLDRFLKLIPYTALGALILPGIFTAVPDMPIAGIAGGAVALAICFVRGGTILPIFGAILTSYMIIAF